MEYVPFLNSSGAIVAPYTRLGTQQYAAHIPVEPYFETVYLPVVSVDSSALYGDHPENLARLTYSSGAALTFFCDSEAGGMNTSGAGTFADPWRSLHTASRYLSCNACVLNAGAEYIQLKIKGTVNYHTSSRWDPLGNYNSKLILCGWGEKCDLAVESNAPYYPAGYLFDLRVTSNWITASGCTFVKGGGGTLAVDCEFASGGGVSCAYNCSAPPGAWILASRYDGVNASICCGGSYGMPISARYAYAPTVSVGYFIGSSAGLTLSGYNGGPCAAVGARVTVSCAGIAAGGSATAVLTRGSTYLADCLATAVVSNDQGFNGYVGAVAKVLSGDGPATVVNGGSWHAAAYAVASGSSYAHAEATASGFASGTVVSGAVIALTAEAAAHITGPDGTEFEGEYIYSGGTTCSQTRERKYSAGIVTSTYIDSGCWP